MNSSAARVSYRRPSPPASPDVATSRIPIVCGLGIVLVLYLSVLTSDFGTRAVSYGAFLLLGAIAIRRAKYLNDFLNPLTLLIFLCLLRIALPALFLPNVSSSGTVISDFVISDDELLQGQHLATIGLLAVALGWYGSPVAWRSVAFRGFRWFGSTLRPDPRIAQSCVLAFSAGVVITWLYLAINFGDPVAAFLSGVARGDAAPGTSRYGFIAVGLLVTSSVVLALTIASRPRASWVSILLPSLLAVAVLTVFGGRVVALTPVALAVIGGRYLRRSHTTGASGKPRMSRRVRTIGAVTLLGLVLFGYAAFVPQYRGGAGISALPAVLTESGLQDYAEFTLQDELGALHSYALAHRLGAGTMEGRTYPGVLGAVGELAGVEGERPGTAIAQRFGPGAYRSEWGFQTGLVIDFYVNSGLFLAVVAAVIFGAVLRAEYEGFRRAGPSLGSVFLHCFAIWTMIWVYFESIVVLPSQFQISLPVLLLIIVVSRVLPSRGGHEASPVPRT
jgi:hypothetical protein